MPWDSCRCNSCHFPFCIIYAQMAGKEDPRVEISRLNEPSVLCQFSACGKPAEFLLKKPPNRVQALCKKHLGALGFSEDDALPAE